MPQNIHNTNEKEEDPNIIIGYVRLIGISILFAIVLIFFVAKIIKIILGIF